MWRKKIIYKKANARKLITRELVKLKKAKEIKKGKTWTIILEDIKDKDK